MRTLETVLAQRQPFCFQGLATTLQVPGMFQSRVMGVLFLTSRYIFPEHLCPGEAMSI